MEITAILLYGLSFSFSSLTEITDVDATMVVEMVAIPSGLSFSSSYAVAVAMELTSSMALVADATADVDATVDADASNYLIWGCLKRQPLYINYYYVPSYIFHLFHIWYSLLQQVYCHCPEHPY